MVSGKAKKLTIAVVMLGLATIAGAGISVRKPIFEWAEERYVDWKYGDKLFVEFYEVKDLTQSHPNFPAPAMSVEDPALSATSSWDSANCDCHTIIEVEDLLASVKEVLANLNQNLYWREPKIMNGKMMVKGTPRVHLRVKRLLEKLRKGPTTIEAFERLQAREHPGICKDRQE